MAGQQVVVSVLADTRKFNSGLNNATSQLSRFGDSISNFSRNLTVGISIAGAAAISVLGRAVTEASNLEQAFGASKIIFVDGWKEIEQAGANAWKTIGLSQGDYATQANRLGALLSGSQKFAGTQLVDSTKELISLGGDLSATFGGTSLEAIEALSSGLRGEYNPLEKYGIVMSEAILQQFALEDGIISTNRALTDAEKAQARYNYIVEQGDRFTGQFVRENGQFANSWAILQAQFDNLLAAVGQPLLEPLSDALTLVSEWLDDFKKSPEFDAFIKALSDLFKKALTKENIEKFLQLILDGLTWLTDPENLRKLGNFVTALIALGPGLTTLIRVGSGLAGIGSGIASAFAWFTGIQAKKAAQQTNNLAAGLAKTSDEFNKLVDDFNNGKISVDDFFNKIPTDVKTKDELIDIGKEVNKNSGFFDDLAKKASSFFGLKPGTGFLEGLGKVTGKLFLVGLAIGAVDGLVKGLTNNWDKLTGAFSGFVEEFNKFRISTDNPVSIFINFFIGLLENLFGLLTIDWAALMSQFVEGMINQFTRILTGDYGKGYVAPTGPAADWRTYTPSKPTGFGTYGPGSTYNINVQAVTPNAEVGKAITDSIRAYEATGGRKL
jgi:hypothetical protein